MRWSRSTVVLTAVGVGVALAACGGSNKATGPTQSGTVATVDSQYTKDTAAHGNSGVLDGLILLSVDEGAAPTNVSVATDSGPLAMQLIGAVLYDTAARDSVVDSTMLTVAWTSDFSVYLAIFVTGTVGADIIPPHRIAVTAREMAALRARFHLSTRAVGVTSGGDSAAVILLQSATDSAVGPDSLVVATSEAPTNQGCVYQHIQFTNVFFINDSTATCNFVTLTQSFTLHFPPKFGVSPRFAHMAMTPAQTTQAARLAKPQP